MTSKQFKVSIIKYPSGKYGFVGTIPEELCELRTNKIGQKYQDSKIFETREEAEKALDTVK